MEVIRDKMIERIIVMKEQMRTIKYSLEELLSMFPDGNPSDLIQDAWWMWVEHIPDVDVLKQRKECPSDWTEKDFKALKDEMINEIKAKYGVWVE